MPRKVILDVDPGIDDAVAIAMALFDPRLEVVAITAVAGNVSAEQATRNVQALVEQLDPPRWPRIGAAVEPERSPAVDCRELFGSDGLGNAQFQVAELHHQHVSEKVLADEIRAAPDAVTIVALGPLTNIAQLLRRDPSLAGQIGHLVIMGGTLKAPGNVTPAAEFNIYCDPQAAREVFRSRTTKTLVPLDVTSQVLLTYNHLDQLPDESSKVGRLLRRILPFTFRTHRQLLGLEGIHLHDAVALLAAISPELFTTQRLAGDVETTGELTSGATVFDRRGAPQWRANMDVAVEIDAAAVTDSIMRSLADAAKMG
jgi:inosine-uridine nucleoside N-ribohydrolase